MKMKNNYSSSSSSKRSSITPCCSKVGIKRGPWTPEEDELLGNYVRKEGEGKWRTLPKRAGLVRCGKSCRLRWMNYLRPSIKRGQIGADEEDLILRLHRLLGNRWSLIAGRLPGRTDNEIKNYWNSFLSKKLVNQGIDPRTHKPLLSSTDHQHNPPISTNTSDHDSSTPPESNLNPTFFNAVLKQTGDEITTNQKGKKSAALINQDDHCQNAVQPVLDSKEPLQKSDNGLMAMMGSNISNNINSTEEDYLQHYTEDMFSSFLNSLINDQDVSLNQHLQPSNMFVPSSNPLASSSAHTFHKNADTIRKDGQNPNTSIAALEDDQNNYI